MTPEERAEARARFINEYNHGAATLGLSDHYTLAIDKRADNSYDLSIKTTADEQGTLPEHGKNPKPSGLLKDMREDLRNRDNAYRFSDMTENRYPPLNAEGKESTDTDHPHRRSIIGDARIAVFADKDKPTANQAGELFDAAYLIMERLARYAKTHGRMAG
jgi:hypothetical protein